MSIPPNPGSLRIGNKRTNCGNKPTTGETFIQGDRTNPVLGNKHVLHNHRNRQERAQVIEAYRLDFEKDWQTNGPMRRETETIAARHAAGENIILMCWCSGTPENYPCHLDLVVARIRDHAEGKDTHYSEAVAKHTATLKIS